MEYERYWRESNAFYDQRNLELEAIRDSAMENPLYLASKARYDEYIQTHGGVENYRMYANDPEYIEIAYGKEGFFVITNTLTYDKQSQYINNNPFITDIEPNLNEYKLTEHNVEFGNFDLNNLIKAK